MAGVGQAREAQLDPGLLGRIVTPAAPVVTPNAVSALSDAFRQGVITSEDIIARHGELAQTKEKYQLQSLQEAMSPEAVEARKLQQQAEKARAQEIIRQQKQAEDFGPLTQRAERAKTIRALMSDETLGESEKMAAAFQAAGIELPKTPEGFVDVEKARGDMQAINQWTQKLRSLDARAKGLKWEKRDLPTGGQELAPFSEAEGKFLTDAEFGALQRELKSPPSFQEFKSSFGQPGQVIQPVQPAAGAAIVQPIQPTQPVAAPQIQPAPPQVGPRQISLPPEPKAEPQYTEAQNRIVGALGRAAVSNQTFSELEKRGFDPANTLSQARMASYESGLPGQIAATVGQMTDDERAYSTARQNWVQGVLRAESGAAISNKEESWYKTNFFPAVGDSPAIQALKAGNRAGWEKAMEATLQGRMTPQEYETWRNSVSTLAPGTPGGAARATAGPTVSEVTDKSGKKIKLQWTGSGYRPVQ